MRRARGKPTLSARFPPATYRNDVVHRSDGNMSILAAAGAGFMLKPARREDYADRVLPHYVGLYVLRGRGRFTDWHGRAHGVEAGCFVQMPPGRRHTMVLEPDGRWAEFYFTVAGPIAEALATAQATDFESPVLRPGLHLSLLDRFEEHLRTVRQGHDADVPGGMLRVHELLVELQRLDRQRRAPSPQARMIDEACRTLASDLHRPLDVAALARRHHLSYERFRKVFRQHMGLPPGEYRIRRRIDRARSLILQEGLSNKQIAAALGYPDPFTFSRQFRKYVGLTPRAFRKAG